MYNSGRRGKRAPDGYGVISVNDKFHQTSYPIPIIDSWSITDGSYNPIDDTALDPAGGQTIVLYGSGFASGATVNINGSNIGIVTVLDSNRITFTSPALSAASYTIYVSNTDGATAIYVPGLVYSGLPTWSSPASGSIGTNYETKNVSTLSYTTFTATGDATITYSIVSGNLPSGVTLSSSGELSGTLPATSSPTTYSFTIRASDGQNQDSDRAFSLTINPDAVTWVAPTLNGSLSVYETQAFSTPLSATSAAGYGVMYSADTLPTGITLNPSTGDLVGYANTVGNTNAQLTATANTTGRYTTSNVTFTVNQDVVTWSSPANDTAYTLGQNDAMSAVTLSASSAAGYGVQYTANALPTGVTLSGDTISGTPTVSETVYTQLTATSNTTNRTATRFISWTVSVAGDQYFKYNSLLLSANNLIQTPSFVSDNSINNSQLSVFGDTRATNFNPYQHGYYSNYFDGTGDSIGCSNTSNMTPGTGEFTFECWVNTSTFTYTGTTGKLYTTSVSNGLGIDVNSSGAIVVSKTGVTTVLTTTTYLTLNAWNHVAVSRSAGYTRVFINGVLAHASAVSDTNDYSAYNAVYIGQENSTRYFNGYLSNVRFVKGTALYTSNFTPSTTPLTAVANTVLLTCQSNRLIDNSPINHTITKNGDTTVSSAHPFSTVYQAGTQYYSTKFDGTGDRLTITNNGAFDFGSGDFTIEAWVNAQSFGNLGLVFFSNFIPSSFRFVAYLSSTGVGIDSGGQMTFSGTTTCSLGTWYHCAVVRSGNSFKTFINGTQVSTSTYSNPYWVTAGTSVTVGDYSDDYSTAFGIVSNVRVVKGTALYTSNFTPSTTPLTAVSGTVLLTCQDSTLKDNSTNNFTITGSGDAKPIAVGPFTPSSYTNTEITTYGSGYFDGTGDYLVVPFSQQIYNWYSTDTTVELWVYPTGNNTELDLVGAVNPTSAGADWIVTINNGYPNFYYYSAGNVITSTTLVTLNAWNHLSLVYNKSSNTLTLYQNGIKVNSYTPASAPPFNQVSTITIGLGGNRAVNPFYLSDLRITRSTLYTSNFVPQFTSPLSNVTNTQLLTLQTNGSHNNSTFVDESRFNNIVTRFGNSNNGTFSPYGDSWSINFNRSRVDANLTGKAPGTGSHTYEFFFYVSIKDAAVGNQAALLSTRSGGSGADGIDMVVLSDGSIRVGTSGTTFLTTSAGIVKDNTWYHLALVRNETTSCTLYLDGSSVGTFNNSTNLTSTELYLGVYGGASNDWFKGYISNFRYTRAAVYTSNFTAPTSPLNVIANTEYLVGSTNRFIDLSPNNFTVTRTALNGSASIQKFSPFGPVIVSKYYSTYFDGNGDFLTVPHNTALNLSSGDYTIEAWIYSNATPAANQLILDKGGLSGSYYEEYSLALNSSNKIVMFIGRGDGSTYQTVTTTGGINTGTWNHVAWVKSGSNHTIYINGVSQAALTQTITMADNGAVLYIGYQNNAASNRYFNGNISNLRIIKGTALYTSDFTPSTTPLTAVSGTVLLTCQNSLIKDNSTNNFTITGNGDARPLPVSPFTPAATTVPYSPQVFGSSMYFDGTGDYLTAPNTNSFDLSRGAWTIECWFYQHTAKQVQLFSVGAARWRFDVGTNGSAGFLFNSTSVTSYPSGSFPPGQWNHIAATFTNDGTNIQQKSYANGKLIGTGYYGPSADTTSVFYVGRNVDASGGSWDFNGYMTDVLITKGESLYGQSSFYPRTSPAQVTANTAFLLNGTTAGVVDATRTTDLDTVADTKVTNFSPYNGSYYSNYFDGNGDYLTLTPGTFGSADFTIEFWYYSTVTSGQIFFNNARWYNGLTPASIMIWHDGSNFYFNTYTGGGSDYNYAPGVTISRSVPAPNMWHHISLTRQGGTMYAGIDGVITSGALTSNTGLNLESRTTYNIGAWNENAGGPAYWMAGNISNFRIVKGTALYTSNFTPSTTPLTTVSGTSLLTCQSNKFVDNSTNNFTITRNGDVKVATQNPFQVNTGQSYYFDGTGDYIANNTGAVNLVEDKYILQKDFTFEGWIYPSSTNMVIFCLGNETTNRFIFFLSSGNQLAYDIYLVGTTYFTPTIQQNCWTHVALTRSGSTITCYINGVNVGTGTTSSILGNGPLSIGTNGSRNGAYWSGYLSDLRITKGVARTITVPTTPLILK